MAGKMDLAELKSEVSAGAVDTAVAAMVDMHGRLLGKRLQAQYFLDGAHSETHACNYVLTTSIWSGATRRIRC